MNWIDCIYLLLVILSVFSVGFIIGGTLGTVAERAKWWEAQARANRNVEALASPPEQQSEDEFPDHIESETP